MTNTPLDAPTGFTPSDDDRPAGKWMEGFWENTVPWANRFAYPVGAYFIWIMFRQLRYVFKALGAGYSVDIVQRLIILGYFSTLPLIGYFTFRFAQDLNSSLIGRDQEMLERAFRQLHRLLIIGLITAVIWIIPTIVQWVTALEEFNTLN